MKTAKVTEITKVNEWSWPNGTIYYINMKLDNNETISLGKKKSDAFKVWDTVNYETVEENGKTKYKEVKENPYTRRTVTSDSSNKGAVIWMALKIAFEVMYDKKTQNFTETVALAQRIVDVAQDMMNEDTTEEKTEEKFDLPF